MAETQSFGPVQQRSGWRKLRSFIVDFANAACPLPFLVGPGKEALRELQ
jgi:hypothetical protein